MSIPIETRAGTFVVDQFRLVRRLGAGGMGSVWVADDLKLKRQVAIKFLSAQEGGGEQACQRFEREAKLASRICSPNVVKIFAHDCTALGRPFIVMELLEGEDLACRLAREGVIEPLEALSILSQTSAALSAAHRDGLVHRDIKPHNIYLTSDSNGDVFVKLLDFGVAKDTYTPATRLTVTGAVIGTLFYISPEQLAGSQHLSASADIWSMTVTLYEMLTGQVPFAATAIPELLFKISSGRFIAASEVNPELPKKIDSFFARALHLSPGRRYPTIEALSEGFEETLKSSGRRLTRNKADASRSRLDRTVPVARSERARKWVPLSWRVLVLGGCVAAGAYSSWFAFTTQRDKPQSSHAQASPRSTSPPVMPAAPTEVVQAAASTPEHAERIMSSVPTPSRVTAPTKKARAVSTKRAEPRESAAPTAPRRLINYGF